MDVEKSRKFYQDRYYKAIQQFGSNSLTAKICKKKLELLGAKTKHRSLVGSVASGNLASADVDPITKK